MDIFCKFTYVALLTFSLGIYIAKNGEPKEGTYSAGSALFTTIIQMLLLWGGGFFG